MKINKFILEDAKAERLFMELKPTDLVTKTVFGVYRKNGKIKNITAWFSPRLFVIDLSR